MAETAVRSAATTGRRRAALLMMTMTAKLEQMWVLLRRLGRCTIALQSMDSQVRLAAPVFFPCLR